MRANISGEEEEVEDRVCVCVCVGRGEERMEEGESFCSNDESFGTTISEVSGSLVKLLLRSYYRRS